jgi:hypothetical protein
MVPNDPILLLFINERLASFSIGLPGLNLKGSAAARSYSLAQTRCIALDCTDKLGHLGKVHERCVKPILRVESELGYLYQCRLPLWYALAKLRDPDD